MQLLILTCRPHATADNHQELATTRIGMTGADDPGLDDHQGDEAQLRLWMQRLLRLAEQVGETGEIPVAAVVLDERGRCVGWGSNRRHRHKDPLGHAEMTAMAQAARLLGDWRLNRCTLVVTLEPCGMCAGAAIQGRVGRVVYAAVDPKRGALGGCLDLAGHPSAHHRMQVWGGLEREAASALLEHWFKRQRLEGVGRRERRKGEQLRPLPEPPPEAPKDGKQAIRSRTD
jgi:tRNA(adenine34) deaminase